ncbi:MAG: hypothetical protein KTR30_28110 [Saprospiraceae bacterium]|nr:hypothetical protein [Saprospiraceae bacterium]
MKKITNYGTAIALTLLVLACQEQGHKNAQTEAHQPSYWQDTTLAKAISNIPQVSTGYQHQVMVLGTFHFNRSTDGSDVVAKNHIDVAAEQSQKEIQEIVNTIETDFKPTLVVVEWMPSFQAKFDSLYQAYLKGDWTLVKNEAFQIGFRTAKAMELPTIYCVDNRPPQPESLHELDDWDSYAKSVGQTEAFNEYNEDNDAFNAYMDDMLSKLSLKQYLILINSPAHVRRYKALSFTGLVNLGQNDNYVGADLTGNWYRRNTRIFTNVRSLCKTKSERILIIYGAGHKWALDEIFAGSPEFEVIQPFR